MPATIKPSTTPDGAARARTVRRLVFGGGLVLVALLSTLTAVGTTGLASLDELVYRISAVTYSDSFPGSLFNDTVARGTARLYSLLLMPVFALFDGDVALRVGRGLNGFVFAAAAVPVALLVRRLTVHPWAPVAAGLLGVAVPWLTVSTILFSEALGYLLFCCALLAMAAALADPTPRRDLLVLVLLAALILTRVQFVALPIAWVAAVAVTERGDLRAALRRYPFLAGAAGIAVLAVAVLGLSGGLGGVFGGLGGPYSEISGRGRLPADAGLAVLFHAVLLAIGTGLVPAILAGVWARDALAGRAGGEARRVALLLLVVVAAIFVVTVLAQDGWTGGRAEERYYLYATPLIWCGAVAALEARRLRPSAVAFGGAVLAVAVAAVPIAIPASAIQAINGPVSASVTRLLTDSAQGGAGLLGVLSGLSLRDQLVLVTVALTALSAALLARRPHRRWLVLVVPVALQLALTAYGFAILRGDVRGVAGLPTGGDFAALGWIDRTHDGRVTLAENRMAPALDAHANVVLFNDAVRDRVRLDAAAIPEPPYPVNTMPVARAVADPDLQLSASPPQAHVVQLADAPGWQLDGEVVARAPNGVDELVRPGGSPRLRWLAAGLGADGHVIAPTGIALAPGYRATLTFAAPNPDAQARLDVTFGGRRHGAIRFPGAARTVALSACGRAGVTRGRLAPAQAAPLPDGRASAAVLTAVRVERCG